MQRASWTTLGLMTMACGGGQANPSASARVADAKQPASALAALPATSASGCSQFEWLATIKPAGNPSDTPLLHEGECRGGSDSHCRSLGDFVDRSDYDPASAFPIFTASCAAGGKEGCRQLGRLYSMGKGTTKDEVRATAVQTRGCDGGYADACASLAWIYGSGSGVSKDSARSRTLNERACSLGSRLGCFHLGEDYAAGHQGPTDPARAAAAYTKGCDNGDGGSCVNLAIMYRQGNGVAVDRGRGDALSKKACIAGNGIGCLHLTADHDGCSLVLHQKACELTAAEGCASLAWLYLDGKLIPKEPERAVQYFKRACEGGSPYSCFNAGLDYEYGNGVRRDEAVAANLFRRGCDLDNAGACLHLGAAHENGSGVVPDRGKALALYQHACAGKHQLSPRACIEAKRLENDVRGEQAWTACQAVCRTPSGSAACDCINEYLKEHPSGQHAHDAKAALKEVAAQTASAAMKRLAEPAAWQETQETMKVCQDPKWWRPRTFDLGCAPFCPGRQVPDCTPMESYLRDYPDSPHVAEVQRALAVVRNLRAQTENREQQGVTNMGRQLGQQLDEVLVTCRQRFGKDRAAFDACVRRENGK